MEVQALPRSLARLVGDTLYGIQKEYARAVLVAGAGLMFDSLRAVLNGQTVGRRPDRTQILQAAVAGVLLAFAAAGDGMRVKAAASTATPHVAAAATMTWARAESWRTMSILVVVSEGFGCLKLGSLREWL